MVKTFAARRGVQVGGVQVAPGTLLPEARNWFRLDNIIHSGNIVTVVVTEDELIDAIQARCPEQLDLLLKLYGLDPDVYPRGPRGTLIDVPPKPRPRKRAPRKAAAIVKVKPEPRRRVAQV